MFCNLLNTGTVQEVICFIRIKHKRRCYYG
nr:MAG TPA: hypothetical protein [Caudoviricetes sp.]